MYCLETKSERKCSFNNSAVGRKFVSPQLVSAKTVGMRLPLAQALFCAVLLAVVPPAHGQTEKVLDSFANSPDGANPRYVTPVLDAAGNLYGTTNYGGNYGLGTVFKVTQSGTETVLHSFNVDGTDGAYPVASLVMYRGNLYGTTVEGGTDNIDGTVFELKHTTKGWTETILHSFGASGDGSQPYCALTVDNKTGNLYGTTNVGGAYSHGTVFELTPSGTETILWSFGNGTDGANPIAGVIRDTNGNLYGTTEYGGDSGYGAVFKLTPSGTESILHSFDLNGTDGAYPVAKLVMYSGNLYGTTVNGGAYGDGTVFKVTPSGTETILHSFANNDIEGINPYAGLVMHNGNFYGTTANGGGIGGVAGTVFEMTPSGSETILHTFGGNQDGAFPYGGVAFDKAGNLYGTTLDGGANGFGTVFELTP
ncbi:MAG TPA: choice-of-anchor tandem repeat GloVer-containing protein [Candidatus Sulfotelmatobacter sp.]|nr:choice-of-anchor tandem repeat GloVer-containing protein [Candidatus Sulfotelmatobacter sp.]